MASIYIDIACGECDLAERGYNDKTDTYWVQCNCGWMVDNKPGPDCPGPGKYRLVREEEE